jgi:serine/threonine-protein kinase RsbT
VSEAFRVAIATDADVVTARQQARSMGGDLGFSSTDLTLLATAISEVARNITAYAGEGELRLRVVRGANGRQGIEVIAHDEGPGIANVELALRDGFTTGSGLGLGLPGARRLVDEFELQTAPGEGTTVRLVKWGRGGG